jgi:uncharacterized protein YjbJ (UPF0337 family)
LFDILTGGTMVVWATILIFKADAAGVLWPGFTPGMLMLLGFVMVGLGVWGRQRSCQGTSIDGRYLALGVREVNYRGTSLFFEQDERRAGMNEDVLKGKWNEIKGGVKEKWGKLTDDDLTAVEGKKEKLLGLLQQKYGYAKDKAEQEYKDFIGRYKGK